MVNVFHDVPLVHDDVLLFVLDDDLLVNHLHGVEVSIFFESAQKHLRKPPCSDQLYYLEVVQR